MNPFEALSEQAANVSNELTQLLADARDAGEYAVKAVLGGNPSSIIELDKNKHGNCWNRIIGVTVDEAPEQPTTIID